jgi:hypothetical protein
LSAAVAQVDDTTSLEAEAEAAAAVLHLALRF